MSYKITDYKEIVKGRLQLLKLEISDNIYVLLNVYGPTNEDKEFFDILGKVITENNSETLIIGGDFNVVLNFDLDKLNGRLDTKQQNSQQLNKIMENNDLHDIWRIDPFN